MNIKGESKVESRAVFVRGADVDYIAASHEDQKDPSALKKILLDKGALLKGEIQMVNWAKLLKGRSFSPHYHEDMSEIFVVIKGTAIMTVAGENLNLTSGDLVLVPPGAIHTMKALADDVEYLVFGCSEGRGGKTVNVD